MAELDDGVVPAAARVERHALDHAVEFARKPMRAAWRYTTLAIALVAAATCQQDAGDGAGAAVDKGAAPATPALHAEAGASASNPTVRSAAASDTGAPVAASEPLDRPEHAAAQTPEPLDRPEQATTQTAEPEAGPSSLAPRAPVRPAAETTNEAQQERGHCDAAILRNATKDSQGYQNRSDRCEGIYASDVSGSELWLASLTETFDALTTDYAPVHLTWKSPSDARVRLRAVGTESGLYYRMDRASPPGQNSFDWDSELLTIRSLGPGRIGVLAWRDDGDEPLFYPIRATQATGDRPWSGVYTIVVMPQVSLRQVFVTLARVDAVGKRPTGSVIRDQEPLSQPRFLARRPIEIVLDDVAEPGIYYVKIAGRTVDASVDMDAFWFYHAGK